MFGFLKNKTATGRARPAPKPRTVDVLGRALPLTIRENHRATRITLRIEPGGKALKMTVPFGLRHHDIDDFLARHAGWLKERIGRMESRATGALADGGAIAVRGVRHRIEHSGKLRGVTEARVIDGEPVLMVSGSPEHLPRRIADFLKREARRDLESRVSLHATRVGRRVKSMTLKDTRSRWGSCSHAGALSFSWRIVMAPPEVIDYLAAHECAHLREMNHGPKFWALCEELCPQTPTARAWLKENGNHLHAIDFG